ncbi:hypothetical protein RBA41_20100 [Massilia sp. CCM 9210]|uniref:hypothetical protein n=1 Tax=Massilia scottii TaxID=3057166 RepID=UPI0027964C71|nr:hypothetical protein [Massilia sp. CCM 9210]MDQ1815602.1 hypothetical protein [Massilia sp. CCM 9210]
MPDVLVQQGRDGDRFNVRQQGFPIGPRDAAALRSGKSINGGAGWCAQLFPQEKYRKAANAGPLVFWKSVQRHLK